jgi:hypothetical protein
MLQCGLAAGQTNVGCPCTIYLLSALYLVEYNMIIQRYILTDTLGEVTWNILDSDK